jgi:hypothetical protein
MLSASIQLFFLRELDFRHFDFPRWQSVLAVSLLGLLASLDPSLQTAPPGMRPPPRVLVVLATLLALWAAFLVIVAVLRWWMRRGGRWDGQGDLFNLLAASWLVADGLVLGLTSLSVPLHFVMPLAFYGIWVSANALRGGIPKASLGYCFAGILFSLLPGMIASMAVFTFAGLVAGITGLLTAA